MWEARIEEDPDDGDVPCVFIVNDETGDRRRQEGLGHYLDDLRESDGDDFDEDELVGAYMQEAAELADYWNKNPENVPPKRESLFKKR
jgi:hypothetical protein